MARGRLWSPRRGARPCAATGVLSEGSLGTALRPGWKVREESQCRRGDQLSSITRLFTGASRAPRTLGKAGGVENQRGPHPERFTKAGLVKLGGRGLGGQGRSESPADPRLAATFPVGARGLSREGADDAPLPGGAVTSGRAGLLCPVRHLGPPGLRAGPLGFLASKLGGRGRPDGGKHRPSSPVLCKFRVLAALELVAEVTTFSGGSAPSAALVGGSAVPVTRLGGVA